MATTTLLPELQDFFADWDSLPPAVTLADEREAWRRFCVARTPALPAGMVVEQRHLSCPGRSLALRRYRPPGRCAGAILYLHGGGWILGDLDSAEAIAGGLAEHAEAEVVSLDYRLAPEHPFPAALDDAFETLAWMAASARPATPLAVCGDSAGGNLAAALALRVRDEHGPALAAQALVHPVLDADDGRASWRENADAPFNSPAEMRRYVRAYLGERTAAPPLAMPLGAADLRGLPAALVHCAELDMLRDEGYRYYERLVADGTPALYRCARRMPHGFLRARAAGPAAAAEFRVLSGFLRAALRRETTATADATSPRRAPAGASS